MTAGGLFRGELIWFYVMWCGDVFIYLVYLFWRLIISSICSKYLKLLLIKVIRT